MQIAAPIHNRRFCAGASRVVRAAYVYIDGKERRFSCTRRYFPECVSRPLLAAIISNTEQPIHSSREIYSSALHRPNSPTVGCAGSQDKQFPTVHVPFCVGSTGDGQWQNALLRRPTRRTLEPLLSGINAYMLGRRLCRRFQHAAHIYTCGTGGRREKRKSPGRGAGKALRVNQISACRRRSQRRRPSAKNRRRPRSFGRPVRGWAVGERECIDWTSGGHTPRGCSRKRRGRLSPAG